MAPQIDEFTEIFLPTIKRFGIESEFEVVRKGFFPKGGGEMNFSMTPVKELQPIVLTDLGTREGGVCEWLELLCGESAPGCGGEDDWRGACLSHHLKES